MPANKVRLYAQLLQKLAHDVSGKEFEERARKFIQLLHDRGDSRLVGSILKEFERMWKSGEGKEALIVAEGPLSKEMKERFEKILEKEGYRVQEKIDEDAKGGAILFLGNEYMIDGTVRGKLNKIWNQLSSEHHG